MVVRKALSHSIAPISCNIANTTRTAWQRIFTRNKRKDFAVFPFHLGLVIFLIIWLIALASNFDTALTSQVRASNNEFVRFLASITDAAKSNFYFFPALFFMFVAASINGTDKTFSVRKNLLRSYGRCSFIFWSVVLPGIAINIVKQFIGRGRPRTFDEYGAYIFKPFEFMASFQSFPSGHSTTCGALAMIVMLWYPKLKYVAFALFVILALTRIAANAHYLSDVVAGFSIGLLATYIFARYLASRNQVFHLNEKNIFPTLR